ncbi:MAG: sortase [Patescibacteria group bacterium]|jgi:LPXTG-site transpeptidase (sortase) family protein
METILYEASSKTKHIATKKALPSSTIKRVLKIAGYNLIAASVLIAAVSFGPLLSQEIAYRLKTKPQPVVETQQTQRQTNHSQSLFAKENERQQIVKEAEAYGVDTDFSIVIPKIEAKARVIPNVDPANESQYKAALKKGVGHAAGTKFPGNNGPIFLFAHSASTPTDIIQYNAVFYLLKELKEKDEIIVFFTGQKFVYQVIEQFVTTASDIQWLTHQDNQEKLVLQTCWPPGTTQKRLIVVAKPA